jgi:NAD(P)-dependent dehydrogenase (short-subunit alcohol dehydrogenase family)
MQTSNVLITGVTSGTGLGLTKKFLDQGYQVFGSVRSAEKAEELQPELGKNFIPLVFDICKPEEISAAAEELKTRLGEGSLSAIINNAGSARIGPLLYVSLDELRAHLEVLVVGHLAVIQSFYRFLIPQVPDYSTGKIINISSVSGEGHNYMFGCYATGKHALEGLSKTLRKELEIFGIKVIVVAPGNISTSLWGKQTEKIINEYAATEYFPSLRQSITKINSTVVETAMTIEDFSEAFFGIYTEKEPADRYTIVKTRRKKIPFSKEIVRVLRE